MAQGRWVRLLGRVGVPSLRVVCFPHSGGSASHFRSWQTDVVDAELLAVQYPGRGERMAEQFAADVPELALAVAAELPCDDLPTVLFGHSLGAFVAFETARLRQAAGLPVHHLFVSGCRAPTVPSTSAHLLDDEELWAEVHRLGGIDPEVAANEELRELVLPVLRADIRASEIYRPASVARLASPIRCYGAENDPLVDQKSLRAWAGFTSAEWSLLELPGGHFPTADTTALLIADLLDAARVGSVVR